MSKDKGRRGQRKIRSRKEWVWDEYGAKMKENEVENQIEKTAEL